VSELLPATPGQEAELERLRAKGFAHPDGSPEAREKLRQELGEQAHRLRVEVFAAVAAGRTALWETAAALYRFREARAWEPCGYRTFEDFLKEPELEIGERQVQRLIGTYRALVIERGVSPATLDGVDLSKIEPTLPAIKAGDVSIDQAIGDARTLKREDVRAKYSADDPNAPIDPGTEPPPKVPCEACDGRGWVAP
jgi:hypothetical protein